MDTSSSPLTFCGRKNKYCNDFCDEFSRQIYKLSLCESSKLYKQEVSIVLEVLACKNIILRYTEKHCIKQKTFYYYLLSYKTIVILLDNNCGMLHEITHLGYAVVYK